MDENSFNYNPNANVNDGTCCYLDGCTDPVAWNYNNFACFDDGSCDYLYGCMDVNYVEYNPNATFDDGSCFTLIIYGCTDSNAGNYDDLATVDDGSCISAVQIDLLEVCHPVCDNDLGAVVFELSGGVPPYSFVSNLDIDFCGQFNGCGDLDCFSIDNQEYYVEGIYPGFHSITVMDEIGYTFDISFSIFDTDELMPFIWEDGEGLSTFNNSDWSYQWFYMGQMLFSETDFEMTPQNGTGMYAVQVTDLNGCVGYAEYQYESSSLDSFVEQGLYLFPNPSIDKIYLNNTILSEGNLTILVTDNLGKIVSEISVFDLNNVEIIIQDLDPGIYYVNIFGDKDLNKKLSFVKTNN